MLSPRNWTVVTKNPTDTARIAKNITASATTADLWLGESFGNVILHFQREGWCLRDFWLHAWSDKVTFVSHLVVSSSGSCCRGGLCCKHAAFRRRLPRGKSRIHLLDRFISSRDGLRPIIRFDLLSEVMLWAKVVSFANRVSYGNSVRCFSGWCPLVHRGALPTVASPSS